MSNLASYCIVIINYCNKFSTMTGDDRILNQLEAVKGTREMQCEFVREILDEANLFKKRTLAESLKRHLVRLESMSSLSVLQANYHKR